MIFGLAPDFGGKPFSLVHYLAVKSAYEINKPDAIYFHHKYEPSGEYWGKAKPLLTLRKVEPPETIFGNKLHNVAHKSDIIRLELLRDEGGIYLDMDTICKQPFTDLLDLEFVIGEEGNVGLCNAVMMSEKTSVFVTEWYTQYRTFRGTNENYFNEHSVVVPKKLSVQPELLDHIYVEGPRSFHYPLWSQLDLLFRQTIDVPDAYCHHLWETYSWEPFLKDLTEEEIKTHNSTYNIVARKFLL